MAGWSWSFVPKRLLDDERYLRLAFDMRGMLLTLYQVSDKHGVVPLQPRVFARLSGCRPDDIRMLSGLHDSGLVTVYQSETGEWWAQLERYADDRPSEMRKAPETGWFQPHPEAIRMPSGKLPEHVRTTSGLDKTRQDKTRQRNSLHDSPTPRAHTPAREVRQRVPNLRDDSVDAGAPMRGTPGARPAAEFSNYAGDGLGGARPGDAQETAKSGSTPPPGTSISGEGGRSPDGAARLTGARPAAEFSIPDDDGEAEARWLVDLMSDSGEGGHSPDGDPASPGTEAVVISGSVPSYPGSGGGPLHAVSSLPTPPEPPYQGGSAPHAPPPGLDADACGGTSGGPPASSPPFHGAPLSASRSQTASTVETGRGGAPGFQHQPAADWRKKGKRSGNMQALGNILGGMGVGVEPVMRPKVGTGFTTSPAWEKASPGEHQALERFCIEAGKLEGMTAQEYYDGHRRPRGDTHMGLDYYAECGSVLRWLSECAVACADGKVTRSPLGFFERHAAGGKDAPTKAELRRAQAQGGAG